MALAFVLIGVDPGHEQEAFKSLLADADILELHPLFGEYDFLAKVTAPDFDSLGRILTTRIRRLPGVEETMSLPVTSLGGGKPR